MEIKIGCNPQSVSFWLSQAVQFLVGPFFENLMKPFTVKGFSVYGS